jgi:hypothetical protein
MEAARFSKALLYTHEYARRQNSEQHLLRNFPEKPAPFIKHWLILGEEYKCTEISLPSQENSSKFFYYYY